MNSGAHYATSTATVTQPPSNYGHPLQYTRRNSCEPQLPSDHSTALQDFGTPTSSTMHPAEQSLQRGPRRRGPHFGKKERLDTEEFCALLRQESYDIDECIFEAESWKQQRKLQDWVEDVVDDMKDIGIIRKPSLFEYTWFTVSTVGAIVGWVAGGPIGSVVGSKTASIAVGVGFGIKEVADKYVQKPTEKEDPVPHFELSQNPTTDALEADSLEAQEKLNMTKFELDQGQSEFLSTTMYPTHAKSE